MADKSFDKMWRIEFYNIVTAKDRLQDINFNLLKLKVKESYRNDVKTITNCQR